MSDYANGTFDERNRIAEWLEDNLADDYIGVFGAEGNTTALSKEDFIEAVRNV